MSSNERPVVTAKSPSCRSSTNSDTKCAPSVARDLSTWCGNKPTGRGPQCSTSSPLACKWSCALSKSETQGRPVAQIAFLPLACEQGEALAGPAPKPFFSSFLPRRVTAATSGPRLRFVVLTAWRYKHCAGPAREVWREHGHFSRFSSSINNRPKPGRSALPCPALPRCTGIPIRTTHRSGNRSRVRPWPLR
jgi:hypothetical protein